MGSEATCWIWRNAFFSFSYCHCSCRGNRVPWRLWRTSFCHCFGSSLYCMSLVLQINYFMDISSRDWYFVLFKSYVIMDIQSLIFSFIFALKELDMYVWFAWLKFGLIENDWMEWNSIVLGSVIWIV